MSEAHNHAAVLLEKGQVAGARDLLSQCQECAMHIGDSIEKSEGIGTPVVVRLEEYCEELYEISNSFDKRRIRIIKRQLNDDLHYVIDKVEKEIPSDKIKVVFMPYKASMWDCMESVWEAACADEECETRVIPIPYYNRNEQGSMEEMCYEGSLFPEYVPITHYKEFSLERERPDIIYIHNPYDAANYVTSVAPDYYSSKLKEYTDILIYIPYFFSGEGYLPESHRNLPVYQYADKIVVQDESKAESLLNFVPKEKILVSGSPKVDKILKLEDIRQKKADQIIPKEWREKIKNKKVILYNVSISGVLQNSSDVLSKIQYVISKFESRKDVVLLWRPHPLLEPTLKSMRPELYKEYILIKNDFINKCKGIFDETEDAGIAAVVADAYIGECSSSIIHYFGVLNKPVFYIDWKITKETLKNRNRLSFYSFFKEDNKIFFSPINTGFAYNIHSIDLENEKVSKETTLPGVPGDVDTCYVKILKTQNKVILIPYNMADIYIYDINEKQAVKIVLPRIQEDKMLFDEAVEYDNKIFLLPQCYPAIVSLDMCNYKICEYEESVRPFLIKDRNVPVFRWAYYQKGQYLYLAGCNESKIVIFDMKDGSYEVKNIGNYTYGYFHMIYDGNYFWLAGLKTNCIVRWDENTGETIEYSYPVEGEQPIDQTFLIDNKKEIIVFCGCSVDIMFLDKNTGECTRHKKITRILNNMKKEAGDVWNGFAFVDSISTDKVLIYNWGNSSVNIWNIYTDEWKSIPCQLTESDMLELEKRNIETCLLCKTTPYNLTENQLSISQYIDYVATGNTNAFDHTYECYRKGQEKGTIGFEIHEEIKNALQ